MNKKGFTLIELMLVGFILCVVLSILDHACLEYAANSIKAAQHKPLIDVPWWMGVICVPVTPIIMAGSFAAIVVSYFI